MSDYYETSSYSFSTDDDSGLVAYNGVGLYRHYLDWKSFFHLVYCLRNSIDDVGDIADLEWVCSLENYKKYNVDHLKHYLESKSIRLLKGVDLRPSADRGRLILECAVLTGNVALVAAVLKRGVDINGADEQGRTALHFATMLYDEDYYYIDRRKLEHLISGDTYQLAAVEFFSRFSKVGKTFRSEKRETNSVLKLLLDRGANVNTRDNAGWTAIHFAARFCNKAAIDILLEYGADTNLKTFSNQTLLHCASMYTRPLHVVKSLFNQCFVICKGQDSSLNYCPSDSSAKLIDVNAQDDFGNTALHYLILYHEIRTNNFTSDTESTLELFIEYGSGIRLKNNKLETATELLIKQIENTRPMDKHRNRYKIDTRVNCLYLLINETLQNDRGTCKQCLDCFKNIAGTNVIKTENWNSLFCFAVENGNDVIIDILLQYGPEFGVKGNDGKTVLHVATEMGNVKMAKLLLYSGLTLATKGFLKIDGNLTKFCNYVNAQVFEYFNGGSATHIAVRKGNTEILQLILGIARYVDECNKTEQEKLNLGVDGDTVCKIDINILDCFGAAPLHVAVRKGDIDAVKMLLIHGADVNAKIANHQGLNVFHLAVLRERDRIENSPRALLSNRNFTFMNPSPDVARQQAGNNYQNKPDSSFNCMVQLLLEHGADINSKSSNGDTVLHMAVKIPFHTRFEMKEPEDPSFYNHSDYDRRDFSSNYDEYESDDTSNSSSDQEMKYGVVKPLLVDSADVYNMMDKFGKSVVQCALALGYVEIFKRMVRDGKDVNLSDKEGRTVLMLMVGSKLKSEVIQEELQSGADVAKRDSDGFTALHYARTGYAVDLLLSHGADLNAQNNDGLTPLHCVLKCECDADCLDALLLPSRLDIKDNDGKTARDYLHVSIYQSHVQTLCILYTAAGIMREVTEIVPKFKSASKYTLSSCSEEIKKMKSTFIDGFGLYTILSHGLADLRFTQNANVVSYLEREEFRSTFVHYNKIVKRRFVRAKKMHAMLDEVLELFTESVSNNLCINMPMEVSRMILLKTTPSDVTNLKRALQPGGQF